MPHTPAQSTPRRWLLAPCDAAAAVLLVDSLAIPLPVASLLVQRGLHAVEEARAFLHPEIGQLHDPYSMLGMAAAVERIQRAVAAAEPILIYGDYDVDGTTAVVLLKTAIERLGGSVRFHVPHRLREGYGMQREVLERAAAEGVRLVISVDTGIRAFAAAEAAEALGLDLIVTDHHLPDGALPRALAVLNPNQSACSYACKGLCGAGVAFKLSQALLEASAADDPEAQKTLRIKTLPSFLKMLAIATVADAVPLLDENRAIVALGLAALHQPASPGLRALLQVAQLDPAKKRLTAMDIGFRLGPRINAAGRMDIADDVVELFTTRDAERARVLAAKLDTLNTERRTTEASALEAVMQMLETPEHADARCLVLDGEGWHRGVIGILASRVVDKTGKPALVIAHEAGEAYGSGRSIEGFHLLEALESCAGLFTRFGGHAHAVGFSLPSQAVPELRERMKAYAAEHLSDESLTAPVHCDASLSLGEVTPALFAALRQLEPFGMENLEPAFVTHGVQITAEPRVIKDRHIKLQLGQDGVSFSALGWHWAERVGALALKTGATVDLVYRLRQNEHPEFGGLELEIVDLRRADASPQQPF
jgi:single-stranded-DNA-specific exonuclease